MVTILDDDGEELATCVELFEGPRGLLVTRVLSGKGRLLTHYFARGSRSVQLEFGMFRLSGLLETAWRDGEREWRVRLEPASRLPGYLPSASRRRTSAHRRGAEQPSGKHELTRKQETVAYV